MKKVDFVKIKAEFWGFGFGKGTSYGFNKAEDIIRERIENGWEFCGYSRNPRTPQTPIKWRVHTILFRFRCSACQ